MGHSHSGKHWRRSRADQASCDKKWSHSHAHVEGEEVHVHKEKEELRRDTGSDPGKNNRRDNNANNGYNHNHLRVRQVSSAPVASATVVQLVGQHDKSLAQYTVPTLPATVSDAELGLFTIPEDSGETVIVSPTSSVAPISPTTPPARTATQSPSPPAVGSLDTRLPDTSSNGNAPPPATNSAPEAPTASTAPVSPAPASSDTPSTPSAPIATQPESIPASSIISQPASSTVIPSAAPTTGSPATTSIVASSFPTVPLPSTSVQPSSALSSSLVTLLPSTSIPIPSISSHPIPVPVSASAIPILISASIWPSLSSTSLVTSTIVVSSTSTYETSSSTLSSETSTTTSSETSYGGGNGRWGPTDEGYPVAPTDAADPANHDSSSAATKPKIIGGVIGGVTGAALLLALLFLLLRLKKRRLAPHALAEGDRSDDISRSMSETPFAAAAAAGASRLLDRFRTSKQAIVATAATGERGFQKLGGRKLQSVLETGGDGYDDSFGVQQENPFADPVPGSPEIGSSAAHPVVAAVGARQRPQSRDIERLGSSQRFPTPPLGRPESQSSDSSGQIVVRPSPAHTPITSSADLRTTMGVSATTGRSAHPGRAPTGPLPPVPVLRPTTSSADAVGRTHPSANNSRASRFTEGF